MELGLYRNGVGAEMHVTGYIVVANRVRSLGDIYTAEARDPLFGTTHYMVTEKSMADCGYVLIERAEKNKEGK